MTRTKKQLFQGLRIFFLCIVCLIALAPFYVAVCYAFKSKVEIAKTKLAFPTTLYLGNFTEAVGLANYFNSFKNSVMSVPAFAMSTAKRLFFLKRLAFQMTMRSHTNFHTSFQLRRRATTVICSVCLSRTSSLALMPLFFRASIKRLAATAAPPIRSDVLISRTLM